MDRSLTLTDRADAVSERVSLLWPMFAVFAVPLAAAWVAYPQTHLPPKFGVFPQVFVETPPGFSWLAVALMAGALAPVAGVLAVPRWFGFSAPSLSAPVPVRAAFPAWFWGGAAACVGSWWLMWTRVTPLGSLVHFAFPPLWWGFVFAVDGLVFHRTGGRSLFASQRAIFAWTAPISVLGWLAFEVLDGFVLGNWSYPYAQAVGRPHAVIVALFLVCFSTVWPAVLEVSALLRTFPGLVARYSRGPTVAIPGGGLVAVGLALLAAMVFLPRPLFFAPWVGPLAVLGGQLSRLGRWSPLADLERGNWSSCAIAALSGLVCGFFWEGWNWGSDHLAALPPTNPGFWVYHVPYLDALHVGEMPILGYAGYLPFGIEVWVMFAWAGALLGFDPRLDLGGADAGRDRR